MSHRSRQLNAFPVIVTADQNANIDFHTSKPDSTTAARIVAHYSDARFC